MVEGALVNHGHAHHVSPQLRDDLLRRLRLSEGQVRGLQHMVEENRCCVDILAQVEAVREALHQVALGVLWNHLERCVTDAIHRGDVMICDELMVVINNVSR